MEENQVSACLIEALQSLLPQSQALPASTMCWAYSRGKTEVNGRQTEVAGRQFEVLAARRRLPQLDAHFASYPC